MRILQWRRK